MSRDGQRIKKVLSSSLLQPLEIYLSFTQNNGVTENGQPGIEGGEIKFDNFLFL